MPTERTNLEKIAGEIKWPEELSEYILNLKSDSAEEQKLEALTQSIYEDSKEFLRIYFPNHPEKLVSQIIQYARQQNWPVEQKVQLGAIDGIEYMWFMIYRGLNAKAWGSKLLNAPPHEVVSTALRIVPNAELDLDHMPLSEVRKILLASYILQEGKSLPAQLIFNRTFYNAIKRSVQHKIEVRARGYEELQEGLRRSAKATENMRLYLRDLYGSAVLWEQDPTGILFVTKTAEGVRNEDVGRKSAERNLPFTVGRAYGAEKAKDLYIVRYSLLH